MINLDALLQRHARTWEQSATLETDMRGLVAKVRTLRGLLARADSIIFNLLNGERDSQTIETWILNSRGEIE